MYFRDIVGLDELKKQLIKEKMENKIPHARLFQGEDGSGALSLALAYARYINCEQPSAFDACGECSQCKKYDLLAHPDLFFLFPTTGGEKSYSCDDLFGDWRVFCQKNFYPTEDDWREKLFSKEKKSGQMMIYTREGEILEEKLSLTIAEAAYRVTIIYLPEKMNVSLANKLLKTIEEPGENNLFFLVSSKPEHILGTIVSRTQTLQIRNLGLDEMESFKQVINKPDIDQEMLSKAFHIAKGNCKKIYQLIMGDEKRNLQFNLFQIFFFAAMQPNPMRMKELAEDIATKKNREEQLDLIEYIESYMREMLVYAIKNDQLSYLPLSEEEPARLLDGAINTSTIGNIYKELELAKKHIRQNVNGKMVFFDLFLRMTAALTPCFIVKKLR